MQRIQSKRRFGAFGIVFMVALSNIGLYGLPYMKDQFYSIMIEALGVSHSELSVLFTIFGIISLFSYIFGGFIVDRYSAKTMMCVSLLFSGLLHLYTSTIPPYKVLCIIFALMAFAACFSFYPASMKLLNGVNKQGRGKVFGGYVSILSAMGTLIVLLGIIVLKINADNILVFKVVVSAYGFLNLLMSMILFIFMVEDTGIKNEKKISISEIPKLACYKKVWLVAGVMFLNYLATTIMTYLITYLEYYKVDETSIIIISVIRTNIITIVASAFSGILTDKIGSAISMHMISFCISGAGAIVLFGSTLVHMPVCIIVGISFLNALVIVGAKSVNFVMLSEIEIPTHLFGTTVGVISFVSFSPDAFFYRFAGHLLDKYELHAFIFLFGILAVAMIFGIVLCNCLHPKKNKEIV